MRSMTPFGSNILENDVTVQVLVTVKNKTARKVVVKSEEGEVSKINCH